MKMKAVIEKARGISRVIFFAGASSDDYYSIRPRPADRQDGVVCVHASDGRGNVADNSLSRVNGGFNLATLGVSIPSKWHGEDALKSG